MKIITPDAMRSWEQSVISRAYPSLVLMEHAALGVLQAMLDILPCRSAQGHNALFLCGTGNNGGDGLAAARLFDMQGGCAYVVVVGEKQEMKGDARINLDALLSLDMNVHFVCEQSISLVLEGLPPMHIMVDALLGIGLDREVTGAYRAAIAHLQSGPPVVAVDVPTGVDAANGHILGCVAKAVITVTFGLPKVGHLLYPARDVCGELRVWDIGLPKGSDFADGPEWLDETAFHALHCPPKRVKNTHKGTYGHVLVVAGSFGMAGAAALCAGAALRAGAGLVTLCCPDDVIPLVQMLCPCAMAAPLSQLEKHLAGKDVVAFGPGVGRDESVTETLCTLLKTKLPMVLDADGLFALARHQEAERLLHGDVLITPHMGEFSRLTGFAPDEIAQDILGYTQAYARRTGSCVLLKGSTTVLHDGKTAAISTRGNAGMATGGSGDVLCGLVAGLCAQMGKKDVFVCGQAGAFLHGVAGEMAALDKGEHGLIAQDILRQIPCAILAHIS